MLRLVSLAGATGLLIIASYSSALSDSFLGFGSSNQPSAGYVVGDEPVAVKTAAQILSQGGSAADAAAAMYFAMSVTYPVSAGLGGGGLCVVHDATTGTNETFDFLPRASAGGGSYAVPGAVRGMAAIQGAWGKLPWQRVVGPAESMAATGFPISAALATRLNKAQGFIRYDAQLSAEFLDESGQVKKTGSMVSNLSLAQTLGAVRERGSNGFYSGTVAQRLVDYATAQGGNITLAEMNAYAVKRDAASARTLGGNIAYGLSGRVGSGAFASALLSHVVGADGNPIPQENPAAAVAAATKQSLDQFGIATLPEDLGATGFAVTDSTGQGVSCAVTMNGPFGSDHTAAGTGVTLATAPSQQQTGLSSAFLSPVIVTQSDGSLLFVAAGAGGPNGTASIVYGLLRLAAGADPTTGGVVRTTGVAPLSTINAIGCNGGVCIAVADPAAQGLGLSVVSPSN